MSEYCYVEKPFLDQFAPLGWMVSIRIRTDSVRPYERRAWQLPCVAVVGDPHASIRGLYPHSARPLTARVHRDLRRPRVARAQGTLRAISPLLTAHSPPCYDAHPMSTRSELGRTNLAAIGVLVGLVITGVWIWKRLSLDTQEYVIDQAIPMAFAGLVIAVGLWMLVRVFIRRRAQRGERAKLMAAFERATVQEKKLEIAFALIR